MRAAAWCFGVACVLASAGGCRNVPEEKWQLVFTAKCDKIVRLVVERPRSQVAGVHTEGSVTAEAVKDGELLVFKCPRERMRVFFDVPAGQPSWLVMSRHEVEWYGRGFRYSLEVHLHDEVEYAALLVESGSGRAGK